VNLARRLAGLVFWRRRALPLIAVKQAHPAFRYFSAIIRDSNDLALLEVPRKRAAKRN
jgi:hypothetical protein